MKKSPKSRLRLDLLISKSKYLLTPFCLLLSNLQGGITILCLFVFSLLGGVLFKSAELTNSLIERQQNEDATARNEADVASAQRKAAEDAAQRIKAAISKLKPVENITQFCDDTKNIVGSITSLEQHQNINKDNETLMNNITNIAEKLEVKYLLSDADKNLPTAFNSHKANIAALKKRIADCITKQQKALEDAERKAALEKAERKKAEDAAQRIKDSIGKLKTVEDTDVTRFCDDTENIAGSITSLQRLRNKNNANERLMNDITNISEKLEVKYLSKPDKTLPTAFNSHKANIAALKKRIADCITKQQKALEDAERKAALEKAERKKAEDAAQRIKAAISKLKPVENITQFCDDTKNIAGSITSLEQLQNINKDNKALMNGIESTVNALKVKYLLSDADKNLPTAFNSHKANIADLQTKIDKCITDQKAELAAQSQAAAAVKRIKDTIAGLRYKNDIGKYGYNRFLHRAWCGSTFAMERAKHNNDWDRMSLNGAERDLKALDVKYLSNDDQNIKDILNKEKKTVQQLRDYIESCLEKAKQYDQRQRDAEAEAERKAAEAAQRIKAAISKLKPVENITQFCDDTKNIAGSITSLEQLQNINKDNKALMNGIESTVNALKVKYLLSDADKNLPTAFNSHKANIADLQTKIDKCITDQKAELAAQSQAAATVKYIKDTIAKLRYKDDIGQYGYKSYLHPAWCASTFAMERAKYNNDLDRMSLNRAERDLKALDVKYLSNDDQNIKDILNEEKKTVQQLRDYIESCLEKAKQYDQRQRDAKAEADRREAERVAAAQRAAEQRAAAQRAAEQRAAAQRAAEQRAAAQRAAAEKLRLKVEEEKRTLGAKIFSSIDGLKKDIKQMKKWYFGINKESKKEVYIYDINQMSELKISYPILAALFAEFDKEISSGALHKKTHSYRDGSALTISDDVKFYYCEYVTWYLDDIDRIIDGNIIFSEKLSDDKTYPIILYRDRTAVLAHVLDPL